jgi:hypothetical protein
MNACYHESREAAARVGMPGSVIPVTVSAEPMPLICLDVF